MNKESTIVACFIGGDETWSQLHQGSLGEGYRFERVSLDDERLASGRCDLVLVGVDGVSPDELSARISAILELDVPVFAVAEATDSAASNDALRAGATDVIQVPAPAEMLRARLRAAAQLHEREQRRNRRTADRFGLLQETLPLLMYEGTLSEAGPVKLDGFHVFGGARARLGDLSIESFDEWRAKIHPDDLLRYEDALRAVRTGEMASWSVEYRWTPGSVDVDDPEWIWIFDRGARARAGSDEVIGFALDISERKSLELQLTRAQKMEAIGRLAGGVAHDFNNLLTAIINFTWYVRDELPDDSPLRGDLAEVLKAAESGAYLTSQLLAFSRRQPTEPTVIELNDRLRKLHEVLQRTLGEMIEVVVEPADESVRVTMDPGQFDQLLFNLAVNSRDAMPSGGALYIRLRREGETAVIEVADTGVGIESDVIDQIFDPFFSTKGESGTGLGLATCYGIARQAGGDITVRSEPGEGASFVVRLPLEVTKPFGGTSDDYEPIASVDEDTLAIVVEDQPAILTMVKRLLQGVGYVVEAVPTAEDALAMLSEIDSAPDILISDVVLPGLSGPKLMHRVRRRWPELPVLLMSGYLGEEDELALQHKGASAFLPKPFTPAQFIAAVARLTGESNDSDP